jgi:hypothetical protein
MLRLPGAKARNKNPLGFFPVALSARQAEESLPGILNG